MENQNNNQNITVLVMVNYTWDEYDFPTQESAWDFMKTCIKYGVICTVKKEADKGIKKENALRPTSPLAFLLGILLCVMSVNLTGCGAADQIAADKAALQSSPTNTSSKTSTTPTNNSTITQDGNGNTSIIVNSNVNNNGTEQNETTEVEVKQIDTKGVSFCDSGYHGQIESYDIIQRDSVNSPWFISGTFNTFEDARRNQVNSDAQPDF